MRYRIFSLSFIILIFFILGVNAHTEDNEVEDFIVGETYYGGNHYFSDNFKPSYLILISLFSLISILFLILYTIINKFNPKFFKKAKYKKLFLFLIILIIFSGSFFANEFIKFKSKESYFILETINIPTLNPHTHAILKDNVYDHGFFLNTRHNTKEDFWITKFNFTVKNAPKYIVHHSQFHILNKSDTFCPESKRKRIQVTSGSNENGKKYSSLYAIFISKNTLLEQSVMIHNPYPPYGPGDVYHNVTVVLNMTIKKKSIFDNFKPLEYFMLHLDETPCSPGYTFVVPANSENFVKKGNESASLTPWKYTFPEDGEIIYYGPHFHPLEGGKKLTVYLNDNILHEFEPTLLTNESWSWLLPTIGPTKIKISKNDTISITSTYDNLENSDLEGAMGILSFLFAPDK